MWENPAVNSGASKELSFFVHNHSGVPCSIQKLLIRSHNRLSVSQNTLGIYQPSQGITVKIYPGTLCSDLTRDMMPRMRYDSASTNLLEQVRSRQEERLQAHLFGNSAGAMSKGSSKSCSLSGSTSHRQLQTFCDSELRGKPLRWRKGQVLKCLWLPGYWGSWLQI